jgi:hypothetical protein
MRVRIVIMVPPLPIVEILNAHERSDAAVGIDATLQPGLLALRTK